MTATVRPPVLPFQRHRAGSPFLRIAQELGLAREKTARDQVPWLYRKVALVNRIFLEYGMTERVAEHMAVIDASLMGEVPPLADAIHAHNHHDATEDVAQAEFIKNAGDAELDAWIKKLAGDIHHAEVLLKCLITERDARRADR